MKARTCISKGQMALDYVRQRDETIPESSMGRLGRQKQYITGFIDQAKAAVKKDVTLPAELFQQLTDYMCTNITLEDLAYLAPELVNIRLNPENIVWFPVMWFRQGNMRNIMCIRKS